MNGEGKEGGSQVWIADFDGAAGKVSEVHKLTSFATEAGGELWSPDGKNILFTSDVYPECDGAPDAEAACNAKKLKEAEQSIGGVVAHIVDQGSTEVVRHPVEARQLLRRPAQPACSGEAR